MKTIPLTQGRVAVVDDKDYERLSQWRWFARRERCGNWYAARSVQLGGGRVECLLMHRIILGAEPGQVIDHVDGDGLNNQRSNLRFATPTTNQWNRKSNRNSSSAYKGVSWHKGTSKWAVEIRINGRRQHLGYFSDEKEAAHAYDRVSRKHHGEFARLNFPGGVS